MLDTTVPAGPRQGGFVSAFTGTTGTRAFLQVRYSNPATDPDLVEAVAVERAKARAASRRVVRLDQVPADDPWYVR